VPELRAKDFEVHADVRKALTLPAQAFTDPAFLDRELATIFRDAWLLVPDRGGDAHQDDPRGIEELVRRRGSRAPFSLLGKPLFLQRDWDGQLRAFPNVCTHAWHTLVQGPARERTITCPQHGRQFDCAGKFAMQPGFEKLPGFPRPEDSLQAFPAEAWGPFVFASLGNPAQPLADLLGPAMDSLQGFPLAALKRKPLDAEARELEGNWKQHAWNYLDSLHIPYIHRKPGGLADAVDLDSYRTEVHGSSVLQWAYARDPAHGLSPEHHAPRFAAKGKRVFALWWFVWPNLALNVYPWGVSLNVFQPSPSDPGRTRFLWYHHVLDEKKYAVRDAVWKMRDVDDEDVDALAQVRRGAASGLAPRGRFAPGKEDAPHWFHRRVWEGAFGTSAGRAARARARPGSP
jgi:choline monooxygenase